MYAAIRTERAEMKYLHTMIRVRDLDAALEFFCTGLGLRETRRKENPAGKFTLVFLAADETPDAEIELTWNWDSDEDYGSATGNVLDNDSDVDNTLSVSSYSVAGFRGNIAAGTGTTIVGVGSIVIDANGHYSFTPDANYHGAVPQITYTTNTGASSTLDITVNSANDLPMAENANKSTLEDTPVSGQVVASDVDGDALTYTLKPGSGPVNGTLVLDSSNGKYTYTPDHDYNGNDSFTVVVSDGQGGTVESVVSITVTAVNDAPIAHDDSATIDEDHSVTIDVLANDTDIDSSSLSVTGASASHGSVTINQDGTLTYTPDANYGGSDTIVYTISDGDGGTSSASVTVGITPVADAPLPKPIPAASASCGVA